MKRSILMNFWGLLIVLLLSGCNNIKYGELYEITDDFVEKLSTTYESYGLFGGLDDTRYTENKDFKVTPMGRLINVRIEHVAEDEEYEDLREALESHYKGNSRVNQVYRCQGGTIMIDCRR